MLPLLERYMGSSLQIQQEIDQMRLDLTQKVCVPSRNEKLKQVAAATPTVTTNVAEKVGVGCGVQTQYAMQLEEETKMIKSDAPAPSHAKTVLERAQALLQRSKAMRMQVKPKCSVCCNTIRCVCVAYRPTKPSNAFLVWFISCSTQCRSVFSSLQEPRSTRSDYPRSRMSSW